MKLHRMAFVEMRPPPPALRRFVFSTNTGAAVSIIDFEGCEDATDQPHEPPGTTLSWGRKTEAPVRVLLDAVIDITVRPVGKEEVVEVPDEARRSTESALSEIAGHIAILCQCQFNVFSPRPYLCLEPESDSERQWLFDAGPIGLPALDGGFALVGPGGARRQDFRNLLTDRSKGTALLAAALAAGHGVPKLHELMRVFENGFARAGGKLVRPLAEFLGSYPDWDLGYSLGEVSHWVIDLRDPATHADLRRARRVIMDPDVEPYLVRIEQAAYDVLFNKEEWHSPSPRRLQRWSFGSMNRSTGAIVSTAGEGEAPALG